MPEKPVAHERSLIGLIDSSSKDQSVTISTVVGLAFFQTVSFGTSLSRSQISSRTLEGRERYLLEDKSIRVRIRGTVPCG
jgi:hypothetical protein